VSEKERQEQKKKDIPLGTSYILLTDSQGMSRVQLLEMHLRRAPGFTLTVMTRSRERERERERVLIVHAEEEEEDLEKLELPAILSLKIACEFKLQLPWLRLSYTCIRDQGPTLDPKLFTTVHDSTPLDLVSIICTWPRALTRAEI
jgi:hypothetical protein